MEEPTKLPTLADLTADLEIAFKNDQLNLLLNQPAPEKWVKQHPSIKTHRYLPIDKVELMLKKIFKRYRIEITGQGHAFNGVWVTIRLHVLNPVTNEWDYHDGIGASQLQTKSGTSPADLMNINNGALSMAFPIAKSLAIKDAAHMLGRLFGSDIDRKDTVDFTPDKSLTHDWQMLSELYTLKEESLTEDEKINCKRIIDNKEVPNFKKCLTLLKSK